MQLKFSIAISLFLFFYQQLFGAALPVLHDGRNGYQEAALLDPICRASEQNDVKALHKLAEGGALAKEDGRAKALVCCFANHRLHSPQAFEYLIERYEPKPLSREHVAAILSINTDEVFEVTSYERQILSAAFHAHGWRIYTFIGSYASPSPRVDTRLPPFFQPIEHLLRRDVALQKLIRFAQNNFVILYAFSAGQSMEDACAEAVHDKGDAKLEKAYRLKSRKWSPEEHFEFLENLFNKPAAAHKKLGLRRGLGNLFSSLFSRK